MKIFFDINIKQTIYVLKPLLDRQSLVIKYWMKPLILTVTKYTNF